jgi:Flp pilus assembly protein TadG
MPEWTMRNTHIHRATTWIDKPGLAIPRRKPQSWRGQGILEFSLVAMLFFLLAFAVVDFSWLMFSQMNMQDAVREAGRFAATGNHLPNPNNPNNLLSRDASIIQVLTQAANGTHVNSVIISSVAGGVGSAGGPGDTVTITANCALPLMTTMIGSYFGTSNTFNFTVSSSFRNEPFPASETI